MRTPVELIEALGGPSKMADKVGRPAGTVALWKHRNSIPTDAWSAVIAAAKADGIKGVSADFLLKMHHGERVA